MDWDGASLPSIAENLTLNRRGYLTVFFLFLLFVLFIFGLVSVSDALGAGDDGDVQ